MTDIRPFPLMLPAGRIEASKPGDPVQTIAIGFDVLLTRLESRRDELKAPGHRCKPIKRLPELIPYRIPSPIGDKAPTKPSAIIMLDRMSHAPGKGANAREKKAA